MDKATFDVIMKFYDAEYDSEKILESKGLSFDDIDDVLMPFGDTRERLLKIGKYTEKDKYINKDTYVKEPYEDIERDIKVNVIYEYENGLNLCETTSGLFYLVPKELLADY